MREDKRGIEVKRRERGKQRRKEGMRADRKRDGKEIT